MATVSVNGLKSEIRPNLHDARESVQMSVDKDKTDW